MADQAPDPQPGFYYVDARDAGRVAWLAGPFARHADALAWLDPARLLAQKLDPWAAFYAFGTLRAPHGGRLGQLNARLGIPAEVLTDER